MALTDTHPLWIELDGAVNARAVIPGVLLRSDNLQGLSDADVRTLVDDHGVQVVLDLRTVVEVTLEGPGPLTTEPAVRIEHHSLYPDQGNTDLDLDTIKPGARPWGENRFEGWDDEMPVVRSYMGYMERRPDSVVAAVRAIARAEGAALVHCAAGKDRTGVVVALALDACSVSRDFIVADYLATTERIELILERMRASETYRAELEGSTATQHAPVPGAIERVLELIDSEHGGSVAWLAAHGLDDADLARLRDRFS